ncbi:hypothetical protein SELR_26800 [Selenomonas ruminantium subsp. lactilytica TAM6421]|uniref:Uncharacterized protein n=1 Tax=Selenomonas ruminantium subsp. lactilytica (strain NBRC 103574 / TAM6421) TaxID=927704 RepID=I0GUF1_SELRL|nr:hypothetical protein SELR_26800 [Selenomonas ruminantium subsp. lactilytica TAM6421]
MISGVDIKNVRIVIEAMFKLNNIALYMVQRQAEGLSAILVAYIRCYHPYRH